MKRFKHKRSCTSTRPHSYTMRQLRQEIFPLVCSEKKWWRFSLSASEQKTRWPLPLEFRFAWASAAPLEDNTRSFLTCKRQDKDRHYHDCKLTNLSCQNHRWHNTHWFNNRRVENEFCFVTLLLFFFKKKCIKEIFGFLSEFYISIAQETRTGTEDQLDVFFGHAWCHRFIDFGHLGQQRRLEADQTTCLSVCQLLALFIWVIQFMFGWRTSQLDAAGGNLLRKTLQFAGQGLLKETIRVHGEWEFWMFSRVHIGPKHRKQRMHPSLNQNIIFPKIRLNRFSSW